MGREPGGFRRTAMLMVLLAVAAVALVWPLYTRLEPEVDPTGPTGNGVVQGHTGRGTRDGSKGDDLPTSESTSGVVPDSSSGTPEQASSSASMPMGRDGVAQHPRSGTGTQPVDPIAQPRTFWVQPLEGLTTPPAGFTLDGLELVPEGLRPSASRGAGQRQGRLASPSIRADFPFNAITPLWRADLPIGSELLLELSVSADGQRWERWVDMLPDPDSVGRIAPTYPDGSPNPNYGFTSGGLETWGLTQWRYFRFRVTLSSSSAALPTLRGFRFYYQDTTLGTGRLATPGGDAAPPGGK